MAQNEHYLKLNSNLVEIPNLSPRAKLLYGYIVSLSQQNGYCFATNTFFMKKLRVSERTVTVCLHGKETSRGFRRFIQIF